jgi:hypothetical protein
MWAPLLVDTHDQPSGQALTLFEMTDARLKRSEISAVSLLADQQQDADSNKNIAGSSRVESLEEPPPASAFGKTSVASILKKSSEVVPVTSASVSDSALIDYQMRSQGGSGTKARTPMRAFSSNITPKATDRDSSRWRPLLTGCGSVKNKEVPRTVGWKFQDGRGASVKIHGYKPAPSLLLVNDAAEPTAQRVRSEYIQGSMATGNKSGESAITRKGSQHSSPTAVVQLTVAEQGLTQKHMTHTSGLGPAKGSIAWQAHSLVTALESKMRVSRMADSEVLQQLRGSDEVHTIIPAHATGGDNKISRSHGESLSLTQQVTTQKPSGDASSYASRLCAEDCSPAPGTAVGSSGSHPAGGKLFSRTSDVLASFKTPHVTMWSHVPGNKIHEDIPVQEMSNGGGAYLYRCVRRQSSTLFVSHE